MSKFSGSLQSQGTSNTSYVTIINIFINEYELEKKTF